MKPKFDPSEYYRKKREHAVLLRKQLGEATDAAEIARLKRLIEFAEYVGD